MHSPLTRVEFARGLEGSIADVGMFWSETGFEE
jgi:hypothetical protein